LVCHDPNSEAGEARGVNTTTQEIEWFRNAVPDLTYTVVDRVAEGDKVITRYTSGGTHQGEFLGIPGTCNRIEMSSDRLDASTRGAGMTCLVRCTRPGSRQKFAADSNDQATAKITHFDDASSP
jgi:hypothetical protein